MNRSLRILLVVLAVMVIMTFVAGPTLTPSFAQVVDPKKDTVKDKWDQTATPGNPVTLPDGRQISCSSGSVQVKCQSRNGRMQYAAYPRPGTAYVLGTFGDNSTDWGDVTVYGGDGTSGEVYGVNCNVVMNGTGSNINTHGQGGGSVKTGVGASGNTGNIDGDNVGFTMKGSGDCFRYRGEKICD
jgi:hypothetical protein